MDMKFRSRNIIIIYYPVRIHNICITIFYEIEIVYNILYNKIYTRYEIIYDIIFYLFITIMLKYCVLFSSILCVYYS